MRLGIGNIDTHKPTFLYTLIYFNIPKIIRTIFFRLDSQDKPVFGLVHEITTSLVKNWLSYELRTICTYLGIRFYPKFDQTSILLNETNFM